MRIMTGRAGKSRLMMEMSRNESPLHIVDCIGSPMWHVDNKVGVVTVRSIDLVYLDSMIRIIAEDKRNDRNKVYIYANLAPDNIECLTFLENLEIELGLVILVTIQTDDEEIKIESWISSPQTA
jgi:hypothetical protein